MPHSSKMELWWASLVGVTGWLLVGLVGLLLWPLCWRSVAVVVAVLEPTLLG